MSALDRLAAIVATRFGLRPAARGHGSALASIAEERMRALGLPTIDAYAARVASDDEEQWALAARISNGWTWFFRDRDQLAQLAQRLAARGATAPLIWVAGCSTGDEAYALAMLSAERGLDARIIATDLDHARLDVASRGIYGEASLRSMHASERERWLEPVGDGSWRVREALRRRVIVRRHNLMDAPPLLGRFDAVVCRNVLIHATDAGAGAMWARLTQALAPGGELVLGASDLIPVRLRAASEPPPAPIREIDVSGRPPESVDATALISVGNLFVEAHAFDRAEAAYRRAEALEPCSAELQLALGVLHRKRGDLDRAASALRRAVFLDETMWPAWTLLGGTLARLGAHVESAAAFEQAERARRERPDASWRSRLERLLPREELRRAETARGGG